MFHLGAGCSSGRDISLTHDSVLLDTELSQSSIENETSQLEESPQKSRKDSGPHAERPQKLRQDSGPYVERPQKSRQESGPHVERPQKSRHDSGPQFPKQPENFVNCKWHSQISLAVLGQNISDFTIKFIDFADFHTL